jgi:hypothetical protein
MALSAQKIASINWHSSTQLPVFLDDSGKIADHSFNGISRIKPILSDTDGITFTVRGIMDDVIPSDFLNAGQKLSKTAFKPSVEWVSGQFKPLGNGRFRIILDRSWPNTANYVGLRQPGTDSVRPIFQPAGLTLTKNESGQRQKITFQPIPEVNAHVKQVVLHASSDAGLKVEYYVESGPAIIQGNDLVLTRIPPNVKYPVAVTIVAWQWGRAASPKVKMAQLVKQTFYITAN